MVKLLRGNLFFGILERLVVTNELSLLVGSDQQTMPGSPLLQDLLEPPDGPDQAAFEHLGHLLLRDT